MMVVGLELKMIICIVVIVIGMVVGKKKCRHTPVYFVIWDSKHGQQLWSTF